MYARVRVYECMYMYVCKHVCCMHCLCVCVCVCVCLTQTVLAQEVLERRKDLVDFLQEFVTKFFLKKGCDKVRICMFGSIAAR